MLKFGGVKQMVVKKKKLPGTNISRPKAVWEDEFLFPLVVSSPEGTLLEAPFVRISIFLLEVFSIRTYCSKIQSGCIIHRYHAHYPIEIYQANQHILSSAAWLDPGVTWICSG